MKTSGLPPQTFADGSEQIVIVRGAGASRKTALMSPSLLAEAGTRPTPAELKDAILAALVSGAGINFVDNGDGTTGVAIKNNANLPGAPTAATAAPGTNSTQLASTAFVHAAVQIIADALAGKQATLHEGVGIHLADNGDGTFTISAPGGGGGGGLVDGVYGDVTVSGGGTVLTVTNVTNGTVTVVDEAYGATWADKASVPTKKSLYAKLEALAASITGRVAATAVGAAGGVASLDGTGKVPAAQLPSYVDDVLEFSNLGAFPTPGETGKIYVALDTGAQWRWSGTAYVQLVASPGTTDNVPEGAANKYYTDVRVRAAVMTGLVDVVGTPAATDALLSILGKLKRQAFTVLGPLASGAFPGAISTGGDATVGGNVLATGMGDFVSPSAGTTGAVRVRAQTDNSQARVQITNNAGSVQWGLWTYVNGAATWSGNLTVQGNITYASDARFKTDVRPYTDSSALYLLAAKRFLKDGREQIGFIAQDVEKVIPEAVLTGEGPDGFKSLDLAPIVAALVEQVKHLKAEVAALKAAA